MSNFNYINLIFHSNVCKLERKVEAGPASNSASNCSKRFPTSDDFSNDSNNNVEIHKRKAETSVVLESENDASIVSIMHNYYTVKLF